MKGIVPNSNDDRIKETAKDGSGLPLSLSGPVFRRRFVSSVCSVESGVDTSRAPCKSKGRGSGR